MLNIIEEHRAGIDTLLSGDRVAREEHRLTLEGLERELKSIWQAIDTHTHLMEDGGGSRPASNVVDPMARPIVMASPPPVMPAALAGGPASCRSASRNNVTPIRNVSASRTLVVAAPPPSGTVIVPAPVCLSGAGGSSPLHPAHVVGGSGTWSPLPQALPLGASTPKPFEFQPLARDSPQHGPHHGLTARSDHPFMESLHMEPVANVGQNSRQAQY